MPWYRQFWPWFLIALPATSVLAGIITVVIASADPDGLVVADYYRKGLALNQDLTRQRLGLALGLAAEFAFDQSTGTVSVRLHGNIAPPDELTLELLHPTRAQFDKSAALYRDGLGNLSGLLGFPPAGRWQVVVKPASEAWQLIGSLQLPAQTRSILSPG